MAFKVIEERPFDPKLHSVPHSQCSRTACGNPPTVSRLMQNGSGQYRTIALCDDHKTDEIRRPHDWKAEWGLNGSSPAKSNLTEGHR